VSPHFPTDLAIVELRSILSETALAISGLAVPVFQKAVELSDAKDWRCLDMLASAYSQLGRSAQAVDAEQQALNLAIEHHDEALEKYLRTNLEHYEHGTTKAQAT
jgi:Flp pilus assembly protein TadD